MNCKQSKKAEHLDDPDGWTTLVPHLIVEDEPIYDSGLVDMDGNRLVRERIRIGFQRS